MLSGRTALQGICKAGTEREINYLCPNAKQHKQMSRGGDELQIAGKPFSGGSLPIMSKREGARGCGKANHEVMNKQQWLKWLSLTLRLKETLIFLNASRLLR